MTAARCIPFLLGATLACSSPEKAAPTEPEPATANGVRRFEGARRLDGSVFAFAVKDGRFVDDTPGSAEVVQLGGAFVVPAFIDSHVHLAYDPRGPALLAGGIAAAVDLASPLAHLETPAPGGPLLLQAGPMLTALKGYPTQSWGANGFGWELRGAADAVTAVDSLKERGAHVIKFALAGEPELDDEALSRAVERAHELGMKTLAHALSAADAERAALAGIDILAHTPAEVLPSQVLTLWEGRAVISTLAAFGASAAVTNLQQLREGGTTVLYGTDFGNTRFTGIQPLELQALAQSGLDAAAIIAAGTTAPAAFWGLSELGALEPDKRASFLVLDADPNQDLLTLSRPVAVYIDGSLQPPVQ